ncbi:hypothetical protein TA3x_002706 [Tundrisphaera sp. TA3]|uniref:hypothetical protein n=1 Tax=Tundrisphaera sp. TA3 TaxID=3435775 RepID=UPI003EBD75FE
MASKRPPPKPAAAPTAFPWVNALLIGAALSYGIGLLIARGRVSWPPHQLLANLFTVAGCLGLIGPILLGRSQSSSFGLGEVLWMAGGMVIWVHDLAALARGDLGTATWSTPLGYQPMGLIILAVLLAGWRCRIGGSQWTWTNVTGWVLGIYWVGMAATTLVPARTLGLASR